MPVDKSGRVFVVGPLTVGQLRANAVLKCQIPG
ncbi:hypothetical protein ACVWWN_000074 [Mycobacterium sp. URHB0021]